ncbi:hypothetical protein K1T71_008494 [Dendrolimus kikuchii]|uniref:Uncharacterized protein n=1 Tax=Dendrolimus kikuchii TaxID=765133 RepID=A0ACC1CXM8_9NEOP|nr:hypothetical protein K1T71_008494 [Dendrolimus kikuchii]
MDRISFKINGIAYTVGSEVSSKVTLLDFIRNYAELRGTKYMCREAGCGACIVAVIKYPGAPVTAVNACMVSITSCQDWEVTTIEEVGNRNKGYHVIQKTLANYNGTQCGYCTPAWVMSMYSLLYNKKDLTMKEIEDSFGSNVCRCTGYRPILEAFKKFAKDAPKGDRIVDIEDLQICKKTGKTCNQTCDDDDDWCLISEEDVKANVVKEIQLKDGKRWFKVFDVNHIFTVLERNGYDSYMLVHGNTAKGAYPIEEYPRVLIDISNVAQLKVCLIDQNLIIGAGLTLTEVLDAFQKTSAHEYFGYLKQFYEHLSLVAHIPVRNIGSLGGNLMIKHQHNEFQSDLFLLLETVGAYITILTPHGAKNLTMQQFLRENMNGKVILHAMLPPLNQEHSVVTYKIMPRSQSAHAIVHAGFVYKLDGGGIVRNSRLVFGGLSPSFIRATATEAFLVGKPLLTNETLQSALRILDQEMIVVEMPPEPSVEYRRKLALGLFYKSLLSLCPEARVSPRNRSGATKIHETRPVSDGRQIFNTNPTLWPLNQPIPKIEALIQCAGEAKFSEDIPTVPREVFGAFVLTTVPLGTIVNIDPSPALSCAGVVAFYTAKDIPGLNSFTPTGTFFYISDEEVFCSGEVRYFNQPLGMIVADSRELADSAAKLVRVTYKNVRKPVLDIKEAIKDPKRQTQFFSHDATDKGNDVFKTVKGSNTIYGQYHFTMETLVCITIPTEEGLEVHASTQYLDGVQIMISKALKIDQSRIDVHVRRLGGAYGFKISRTAQVAVACSLAAQKLNRPCRFITSLETNTRAMGKRLPCTTQFEIGVNKSGAIQNVDYTLYSDHGYKLNETLRTLETIGMAELMMDQISYELSIDPIEVRLENIATQFNEIKPMIDTLKTNAKYTERRAEVSRFNAENRWRKRGLRVALLRWTPIGGQTFDVNLSVYKGDGTVVITHGGIEMGQGVNTKCVQIAAYFLKISIDNIQIKTNNTIIVPNCFISGGSIASKNAGLGVTRCCQELLRRLEPIRAGMNNPTWPELIRSAYDQNVDLQVHAYVSFADTHEFQIYGATLAEVEIDVLTGELEVRRVDLLEDVGQSVSPEIDVGQVEGAFVMGLGYWTCEKLVYNPNSGELLTNRTWTYSVPLAKDIPQDWRVYFRKNSYSNDAILGSKCTGEPPMCMSVVIALAIREAIASARQESGIPSTNWFQIDGPYTTESIVLASATKIEDFKLY